MICPYCGAEISEDSRFCPECGAPLKEESGIAEGLHIEREVYSLLSTANLYRIRGLWQEAENKCVEVLRRYPNNPTAHSLLGDIYADQGRWEEAKEWYELAVELNPSSQVDKKKLERVKNIMEEKEKLTKGKMLSWGVVSFALMAISFSVFLFFRWREERTHLPFYQPRVISNAPVSTTTPPSIPLPQKEVSPFFPLTSREENIYQRIAEGKIPYLEGLKVAVDPLFQRATIDVFSSVPFSYPEIQNLLLKVGLPVLQLASSADSTIEYFTLRILAPLGSSIDLAFQGDIPRANLNHAREDTILQLFQNVWWHSSFTQPLQ